MSTVNPPQTTPEALEAQRREDYRTSKERTLLDRAVDAMAALHRAIEPMHDEEELPGRVPPAAMRAFVDALADIDRERCALGHETCAESGWQPIESAPKGGTPFFVALEDAPELAWPAYASDGHIYSRAHGMLNEIPDGDYRLIKATHWHPALPPVLAKNGGTE